MKHIVPKNSLRKTTKELHVNNWKLAINGSTSKEFTSATECLGIKAIIFVSLFISSQGYYSLTHI